MASLTEQIAEAQSRDDRRQLQQYVPYAWQMEFHNASATHPEKMLCSANRVGKSFCAANEVAMHLTGIYPDWWEGHRFEKEIIAWCGSVNNEKSRDVTQWHLLGEETKHGTGTIPGECLVGKPTYRQAGIRGVVDTIQVRHASGGISAAVLKTYEQGWRTWTGKSVDLVWLDEEPEGQDQDMIFAEALTRLLDRKGILLVTFTPLHGTTALVEHFRSDLPGVFLKNSTWDDAPHLDQAEKERLIESYPQHERDSRTKGIPMMGQGAVFPIPEDEIKVAPFEIPRHFARLCGIDFGIDHPGAGAWIAWDRDQDVIYVYDCYKRSGETSIYHAGAINQRGKWIPVSWPHDGMNRGPDMRDPLYKQYIAHGVKMLSMSARYDNEKGGRQDVEAIVLEVYERMRTGRFKVFSHLSPWFEEFRGMHRKNGKIVAVRDDIMKASFYAVMMRRFAAPHLLPVTTHKATGPLLGAYV